MFNVPLNARLPGFRGGLPEDPPGFAMNQDGSARRPLPVFPNAAFGMIPTNVLQITAPTALTPADPFSYADSSLSATTYRDYDPLAGQSRLQDAVRENPDQPPDLYGNVAGSTPSFADLPGLSPNPTALFGNGPLSPQAASPLPRTQMFNFRPNTRLPDFRVGPPVDEEAGFNGRGDGSAPPVPPGTLDVPTVDENYPYGKPLLGFIAPQGLSPNPAAPFANGSPSAQAGDQMPPDPTPSAGSLQLDPRADGGALNFARYVPATPVNQVDPAAESLNPVQKTAGGDLDFIGSARAQTPQAQQPGTSLKRDPSPGEVVVLPDGSTVADPISPTGKLMSPKADLSAVAAAGRRFGSTYRALLSSPEGAAGAYLYLVGQLFLNVSHWGTFDYQRRGNVFTGGTHLSQFANVSNFNVGLFAQQAGLSRDEILSIAGEFARRFSNNSDRTQPYDLNRKQFQYMTAGYEAGQSGMFGQPDYTR